MKKILDVTIAAVLVAALAGAASHFHVKSELVTLFKNVAQKLVPWVDTIVYS